MFDDPLTLLDLELPAGRCRGGMKGGAAGGGYAALWATWQISHSLPDPVETDDA